MADPVWPEIDENKWNLVAENVTSGVIDLLKSQFRFYYTYNATATGIPADEIKDRSPILFDSDNQAEIKSPTAIDIYVWPENADVGNDEVDIEYSIQVSAS